MQMESDISSHFGDMGNVPLCCPSIFAIAPSVTAGVKMKRMLYAVCTGIADPIYYPPIIWGPLRPHHKGFVQQQNARIFGLLFLAEMLEQGDL